MKIGERDVWIGVGKGVKTPRKWWVTFTPFDREWIPPGGGRPGFWLHDAGRRFAIYRPKWHFMLALTPGSRWAKMRDRKVAGYRWIELAKKRS